MVKRKTNSPWGSAYKEGLPSTAVNDRIEVDEILYPSVNTGNIDVATGQWEGVTLSDQQFTIDAVHESVANGATVLSPDTNNFPSIDMTGFQDLFIAIKPDGNGNNAISAVMGPDTQPFANLSPINAAAGIKVIPIEGTDAFETAVDDAAEFLTADVWNILFIQNRLAGQKVMQFQIVNNSGGVSNITFAYLRVI